MLYRGFAVFLLAVFFCGSGQLAGAEMNDRLTQQRFGAITAGDYQAGDALHFTLSRYGGEFLMHFAGESEVYVLYADYGSLGGRVLKYDSGAIAIQVAGWGGMTIYPDNQPDGLPVMRSGDDSPINLPQVSQTQIQNAADDEAAHLAYVRGLHVNFFVDWNALGGDVGTRSLAFDAMENASRGISRFTANPAARAVFAQKVATVRLQTSNKPLLQLAGKNLVVTFNPGQGYKGRASSRAIAFALGKLFAIPTPN